MMGRIEDHRDSALELCRISRLCYDRGLVSAAGGNISMFLPEMEVVLLTASGVSLRDTVPENLLAMGGDGRILDNPAGLKPSKEANFHLEIYKIRPSVRAVVHVHPPHAIVFASARRPIPAVTVSAQAKLKQGSIVPAAPGGSDELAASMVRAIREASPDATIFLMEAHGLTALGPSLAAAFDDAELAEDTARIALLTGLLDPR